MDRWIALKDGQLPRKGEQIAVKDEKSIYPHILIAEDSHSWWVWDDNCRRFFERHGEYSGTRLSFHGITHWTLLESPY